ncbi:MAG: hypothetical protein H6625_12560 [Bdellovibrionaceae bacterium]|nr:hypothetical protein [Pseudobdellovibrionaceae bacterium]
MEFFKANLWEIRESSSLRFLGLILNIGQAIFLYAWWSKAPLFNGQNPVCWGFLPNCQELVIATPANAKFLLSIYAFLIALSFLSFATDRVLSLGGFSLLSATVINTIFVAYDSSLSSNTNSLVVFLSLFFILVPQKLRVTKLVIISSYFIWGILKINNEWLAGYWLSKNLNFFIPPKGIEWIAATSLFAELVAPLFLLSKHNQRFYTGIGLLFVYNIFKGYVEGWESAAILLLFILYFIFAHAEEEKEAREAIYRSYIRPEPSKMWVFAIALIFLGFQIFPQGFFAGSSKLEWPLQYIRNPIPIECKYHTFILYKQGISHHNNEALESYNEKMKCNNTIYLNNAKQLCSQFSEQPDFMGVSVYFLKRVVSQKEFTRVYEIDNLCNNVSRNEFGGN